MKIEEIVKWTASQPGCEETLTTAARATDYWIERMTEWTLAVSATQEKADERLLEVAH